VVIFLLSDLAIDGLIDLCWWQIVIRRLPPTWTSETFADQISPIPDHDYFSFVPGDIRSAADFSYFVASDVF